MYMRTDMPTCWFGLLYKVKVLMSKCISAFQSILNVFVRSVCSRCGSLDTFSSNSCLVFGSPRSSSIAWRHQSDRYGVMSSMGAVRWRFCHVWWTHFVCYHRGPNTRSGQPAMPVSLYTRTIGFSSNWDMLSTHLNPFAYDRQWVHARACTHVTC